MVITMAQAKRQQNVFTKLALAVFIGLLNAPLSAASLDIKPKVETRGYGLWTRDAASAHMLDKSLAAYVKPSLALSLQGNNVSSSLLLQNESIAYDYSERDNKSQDSYSWQGNVKGFDDRVSLELNANSAYRIRDSRDGVFSDIVTGADNLSKTNSYGSKLSFQTVPTAEIAVRLGIAYNLVRSDSPEEQDAFGDFDNNVLKATVELGTERQAGTFWQLSGAYGQVDRDTATDFDAQAMEYIAGLPLLQNVSFIVRGSLYQNDNGRGYVNEYTSYGAGLEYRFGNASRVNITTNSSLRTTSLTPGQRLRDDFSALEIFWAPSRRSFISYNLDKRYFGRTATLNAQYLLKFLTVKLAISEDVQTLTAFDRSLRDLGIMVCPDDVSSFTDCFRRPTANYQLQQGESYNRVFITDLDLKEDLVKRKSKIVTLGYDKHRLTLSMTLNQSEDVYIESDQFNKQKSLALSAAWKLSKSSKLVLNSSFYDLSYITDQRKDNNYSIETGFEHKLSEHAQFDIKLRKIRRDSNDDSFDINESRVWLGYKYNL